MFHEYGPNNVAHILLHCKIDISIPVAWTSAHAIEFEVGTSTSTLILNNASLRPLQSLEQ
jgi:hypothetical protein